MPVGGGLVRPRILFVYQLPSPFILQDRDLLRRFGEVQDFRWTDHRHPARALPRWMVRNRRAFDLVFVWFGDVHASVATRAARLLGKPSVLVAGGYDVSDLPGYGFLSTPAGLRRARGHFGRASRILAVSAAVWNTLAAKFPDVAAKAEVLPLAVDADRFRPDGPRRACVLSVAGAGMWERAWVKGWDRVAEVARAMPDVPFLLIGGSADVARRLDPPPNLTIKEEVPQDALVREYQTASVYLQPSRSEAFGMSVLEAMACGEVPVVTAVGGMPDLVGDAGFVVEEKVEALASAVRRALTAKDLSAKARARAATEFSLARREDGLRRVLESALASPP